MARLFKIFLGAALLCAMSSTVFAAVSDTLDVTVLVRYLSVEVDDGDDPYDFGIVDLGSQTVSATAVTVTNDGNAAEDFQLQIEAAGLPADLSITEGAAAPGADEFKLYALFDNDGQIAAAPIAAGNFDEDDLILNSGARRGDTFHDSGDDDANSVAAAAAIEMWLMFYAPASMSAAHPQQTITVTVTALAD